MLIFCDFKSIISSELFLSLKSSVCHQHRCFIVSFQTNLQLIVPHNSSQYSRDFPVAQTSLQLLNICGFLGSCQNCGFQVTTNTARTTLKRIRPFNCKHFVLIANFICRISCTQSNILYHYKGHCISQYFEMETLIIYTQFPKRKFNKRQTRSCLKCK